jgi:hypothetical protein
VTKDRVAAVTALLVACLVLPTAADARVKVLKRFTSCDGLVTYANKWAPRVSSGSGGKFGTPVPTTGPVPPAAPSPGGQEDSSGGDDTSTTNNQETGVDEPDTVKTDGRTLFAIVGGTLHAYDVRAETPKEVGSLAIPSAAQLLISGKRALVIGYGNSYPMPVERLAPYPGYYRPVTTLTEVDISDPANMSVVRTVDADGTLVDARMTGSTARVVLSTHSYALQQTDESFRGRTLGWLPQATITNRRTKKVKHRSLAPCDAVRRPRIFGGLDMVTVLTIDVAKGLPAIDADAIMSDADTVYASPTSLYVATHKWAPPQTSADQVPPNETTGIHMFDISDPSSTSYKASGEVEGYTLSQYSMSEYKGVLRVATTNRPSWWIGQQQTESESFVTTLEPQLDKLVQLGRVGGLGKGERIYAVRFIDDVGYVVTFRQIDPLYTIDLSDPKAPKVLGELELLGYSAYLHPVGDGLLLGVGQDATPEGRRAGLMVQLFDVSDLRAPKRLDREVIPGYSSSSVEWDQHAFLFWPKTGLTVVPYRAYSAGSGPDSAGAIGYRVAGRKLSRIATIDGGGDPYPTTVERAVVVGKRLFTLSGAGLLASDLDTLAPGTFLPLAQPTYGPTPIP